MNCPLCNTNNTKGLTIWLSDLKKTSKAIKCSQCGLSYLSDLSKSRRRVYGKNYSTWGADEAINEPIIKQAKKANFRALLIKLNKYTNLNGKSILDVGTGNGYLLEVAEELGFKDCYGLEISSSAAKIAVKKFPGKILNCGISNLKLRKKFDVIALTDILEHLPNVRHDFEIIKKHLKKKGIIIITTPNTGSITRLVSQSKWFQYKFEHVIYFNKKSMRVLFKDFQILKLSHNTKTLNIAYYKAYMRKYASKRFAWLLPSAFGRVKIINPLVGELLVIAKKRT